MLQTNCHRVSGNSKMCKNDQFYEIFRFSDPKIYKNVNNQKC